MAAVEKVVYRHTVETFLHHIFERHGLLLPEVVAALQALGIDPRKPRDLPQATWYRMMELSAVWIRVGRPREENLELVGREFLRGYGEGLVGRALIIGARLMGPRRALLRMAESFKSGDTSTTIVATEPGPQMVDILVTPDGGVPEYFRGLFSELLVQIGVVANQVEFRPSPYGGRVFRVSWTPGR
jgi:uncharacterized protein (TIGR02265 family)